MVTPSTIKFDLCFLHEYRSYLFGSIYPLHLACAAPSLHFPTVSCRDDAKLVDMNLPAHTHLILHIRVPQEVAPPVPSEPSLPLPANPIPLSSSPPGPISNPGALFAAADVQSILHNLSVQFGVPPGTYLR